MGSKAQNTHIQKTIILYIFYYLCVTSKHTKEQRIHLLTWSWPGIYSKKMSLLFQ